MALIGLGRIGSASEADAIERALWDLKDVAHVRTRAIKLIVKLSGSRANERLEGMLRNARSDLERVRILSFVDRSQPASAVRVLSAAEGH